MGSEKKTLLPTCTYMYARYLPTVALRSWGVVSRLLRVAQREVWQAGGESKHNIHAHTHTGGGGGRSLLFSVTHTCSSLIVCVRVCVWYVSAILGRHHLAHELLECSRTLLFAAVQ